MLTGNKSRGPIERRPIGNFFGQMFFQCSKNEVLKYSKKMPRNMGKNWMLMVIVFALLLQRGSIFCSSFDPIFLRQYIKNMESRSA